SQHLAKLQDANAVEGAVCLAIMLVGALGGISAVWCPIGRAHGSTPRSSVRRLAITVLTLSAARRFRAALEYVSRCSRPIRLMVRLWNFSSTSAVVRGRAAAPLG